LKVDYKPKGDIFKIGETEVYHIGDSNKVLIIISDIFGAFSGRHQSVADTFAECGYTVYIPEVLLKPYQ
jgi:dienelactone hydrolase